MKNKYSKLWPDHLPRSLTVPTTSVALNLSISAKRYPTKDALVFFEQKMTYEELFLETRYMAGYLRESCHLKNGDRVIIDLQSSPQFIIAFYGILLAGCVAVPINPMNKTEEIKHVAKDSGARVAIVSSDVLAWFLPLTGNFIENLLVTDYNEYTNEPKLSNTFNLNNEKTTIPDKKNLQIWQDLSRENYQLVEVYSDCESPSAILYTSGTTGKPKGCVHTHLSMMHSLVGATLWENITQDSVILATAPMFHVTGLQHSLNAGIYAGSSIIILPRWEPEEAALLIQKHSCSHWANVPTMVIDLLANKNTKKYDISSLVLIFGGGASMPESIAQELFDRTGLEYMEGYGMTETISQTHMNPPCQLRKQCLGIPTFGTKSLVVDPDSLDELPPGKSGEILVSGPQIMKGYWNNVQANENVFVTINGDKFLRTGDLGYRDSDGFFYIADRLKRMINVAGFKVWPAEVEAIFYQHPSVREIAIISSPEPRRGEIVKAVIALKNCKNNTSEESIIEWARKNMANYKVPKRIDFVNQLPKSGTGKIQWRLLQEKEWEKSS